MTAELDSPDQLDNLIDRIRRSEPPAASWDRARARAARVARWRRRRPALVAAVALVIAAAAYWQTRPLPAVEPVLPPAPAPEVARGPAPPAPEPPPVPIPRLPLPGSPFGTNPGQDGAPPAAKAGTARLAGVYASPRLAVAAAAPVFVSTGDADPIRLGGTVPAGHVGTRLHVWNWDRSPESRVLTTTVPGAFTLTPDGTTLLTADGRVVDLATGKAAPLPWWGDGGPSGPPGLKLRPRWLTFSPDGRTLLAFEHDEKVGTARLIDYPAGTERTRIGGLWWAASKSAFTPDGRTVVLFGSDAHLRTFDTDTGKEKTRFAPAFGNTIRAVAVSPDGSRVAGSYQATVRIWNATTGQLVCEPDTQAKELAPDPDFRALTFSPDGKQLAGGSRRLVLWDAADGSRVRVFPRESFGAAHVRFDPTGKVLTTVADFYIYGAEGKGEVTVYPTVSRWAADTGARVEAP